MNRTDKKINELTMKNDNFKDKRNGKKEVERGIVVALPRLQYRVPPYKSNAQHTILQTRTGKRWLSPSFAFGLPHTPFQPQGLDRKNTVIGKCRGKAATATNKQFGTMAGVPRWTVLTIIKLCGSWQVQVAHHCAELPAR